MNAMAYLKNVGKSMGYIAVDIYKDYHPVSSSFFKDSKEFTAELFEGVKSFTGTVKEMNDDPDSLLGLAKSGVKDAGANILSDLKTGKWYNKQRYTEETEAAMAESMGLDFGDFDFDSDSDFDDSSDEDSEDDIDTRNTKAQMANDNRNTIANIKSMDRVAQKMSGAIGTSVFKSTQYLSEVNKHGFKEMLRLNNKGFAGVLSGIGALNTNIGSLMQLGQPITQHINNSATFFAKTNEWQDKVLEKLDTIIKNTSPAQLEQQNSYGRTVKDLITAEGGLNLGALKDLAMGRVRDYMSPVSMYAGLVDPKTIIAELKSNPLGAIIKGTIKAFLPDKMTNATKRMDKALGDLFSGFLTKLKHGKISGGNGPLGGIIDKLLGLITPESGYKNYIDTSNYVKGKVDWDGKSRKALMEVIPTYLAEISHALGNPYKIYDYAKGKFITGKSIREAWKTEKKGYADINQGEFISGIRDMANNLNKNNKSKMNDAQLAQFLKEISDFNSNAFHSNSLDFLGALNVYTNEFDNNEAYNKHGKTAGMSKATWDILQMYMKNLAKKGRLGEKNRYAADIESGRNDYGERMKMLESEDSVFSMLFNGSLIDKNKKDEGNNYTAMKNKGNFLTNLTDQYNNNIFFYLQGLYQNSEFFAENFPLLISDAAYSMKVKNTNGDGSVRIVAPKRLNRAGKLIPKSSFTIKATQPQNNNKHNGGSSTPQTAPVTVSDNMEEEIANAMDEDSFSEYNAIMSSALPEDVKKYYSNAKNGISQKENKQYQQQIDNTVSFAKSKWEVQNKIKKGGSKFKNKLFKKTSSTLDSMAGDIENMIDNWMYGNIPFYGAFKNTFIGEKDEEGKYKGKLLSGLGNAFNDSKAKIWDFLKRGKLDSDSEEESGAGSGLMGFSAGKSKRSGRGKKKNKSKKSSSNSSDDGDGEAEGESKIDEAVDNIKAKGEEVVNATVNKVKSSVKGLGDSIANFFGEEIAKNKKNANEGDKVAKLIDGAMEDAGISKGSIMTGAMVGGGVSLLTGAFIGPIVGAGIGAAVGLVAKSKKVQDALFGEEFEDRPGHKSRKGGLLSAEISTYITNNAQAFAHGGRGAAIGGVAGAFMGSPLLGAFVGSAVGFVRHSESAQETLFGKVRGYDADGNPIRDDSKAWIKQRFIKTLKERKLGTVLGGAGGLAASALIGGPFGVAGNIIVGSAIGFASYNEQMKKDLFGEKDEKGKRKGGLLGLFKDRLVDPLSEILRNGSRMLITDIKNAVKNRAKAAFNKLFKKKIDKIKQGKGILGKAYTAAKWAGEKVFKGVTSPVTFARDRLRERALNGNYGYVDAEGNVLDAAQRNQLRKDKGLRVNTFDEALAKMNRPTLEAFREYLDASGNNDQYLKTMTGALNSAKEKTDTALKSTMLDPDKANEIIKAVNKFISKGEYEKAIAYIETNKKIKRNEKDQIIGAIQEELSLYEIKEGVDQAIKNGDTDISRLFGIDRRHLATDAAKRRALERTDEEINAAFGKEEANRIKNESENKKTEASIITNIGDDVRNTIPDLLRELNESIREAANLPKEEDDEKGNFRPFDAKGRKKPEKEETEDQTEETHNWEVVDEESASGWMKFWKGLSAGASGPEEGSKKTVQTEDGAVDMVYSNGKWVEDEESTATNKAQENRKSKAGFMDTVKGFGERIDKVTAGIGALANGIIGGGKKKTKGLFDKFKDILIGENGMLGGLFSFFTGGKSTGIIGKLLSKYVLSNGFLMGALGIGALITAFNGGFDKLGEIIGNLGIVKGNDTVSAFSDNRVTETDENGYKTSYGSDHSIGGNLKRNFVNGVVMNNGSVIVNGITHFGKKMAGSKIGKAAIKGVKALGETALGKGAKAAASSMGQGIIKNILNFITTQFPTILEKIPFIPDGIKAKAFDFAGTLAEKLQKPLAEGIKKSASASLANIASKLSNFMVVAKVGYVIGKAIDGWGEAESILGITEDASMGQRVIAALISAFNAMIPIVGDLIPNNVIVNIFMTILPLFGFDVSDLAEQRKRATAEVDAYNKEHGTNLSIEAYNQKNGKMGIISKAGNFLKNAPANIANAFTKAGESVVNFGSNIFNGVKDFGSSCTETMSNMFEFVKSGDIAGLIGYKPDMQDGKNDGGMTNVAKGIAGFAGKVGFALPTLFSMVGHKIFDVVGKVFAPTVDNFKSFVKAFKDMDSGAKSGDLGKVTDVKFNPKGTDLLAPIGKTVFSIGKVFMWIKAGIMKFGNVVLDTLKAFGINIDGARYSSSDASPSYQTKTVQNDVPTGNDMGEVTSTQNDSKGIMIFNQSVGNDMAMTEAPKPSEDSESGGASFISQNSAANAGKMIGRNNVGKLGCGPASAAMALGESSMDRAINSAKKYQTAGGTDAGFFGNYFAEHGKSANYMRDTSSIARSIASGKPTVLMGRDSSNTSKANSPFGPSNHYVVAKGIDHSGNIIVNDPEQKHGNVKYSSSILNNVRLGVSGGDSDVVDGGNTGSAQNKSGNLSYQAWNYFKGLGLSDNAVAGIFANIEHEGGYQPVRLEQLFVNRVRQNKELYNYYKDKFGIDFNNPDRVALGKQYTEAIDSGKIPLDWFQYPNSLSTPKKKYGYGIVQFTSPGLKENLYNIAKSHNSSIGNLRVQLDAATDQMKNEPGLWTDLTKPDISAEQAAESVLRKYEKPSADIIDKQSKIRQAAAKNILSTYAGKTGNEMPGYGPININGESYTGSYSGTGGLTGSSSSSSGGLNGILSVFSSIGSVLSGFLNGTSGNSSNSFSNGSSSGSQFALTSDGAKNVIGVANQEVGTIEEPENKVKYNDWLYNKSVAGDAYPWCAAFVSWVFDQAFGGPEKGKKALRGGYSASVSGLMDNFKAANAFVTEPQPGDVIFYKNGSSHTGIVESVDTANKTFDAIEGNTSGGEDGFDRNGGMVAHKKKRGYGPQNKFSTLTGFGRPDWSVGVDGATTNAETENSAAGSGLIDQVLNFSGGDSGISNTTTSATSISNFNRNNITSNTTKRIKRPVTSGTVTQSNTPVSSTEASSALINIDKSTALMLKTIITVAESLSNSSNKIAAIYELLEAYVKGGGSVAQQKAVLAASKAYTDSTVNASTNTKTQDELESLKKAVDAILAS